MSKTYDTGKFKWQHGQVVEWCQNGNPNRWLLGPCPACGAVTSNYGGAYSCHEDHCPNSSSNFACGPEKMPDWWNSDIDVKLDGNAWCATGAGFIDLQASPAGFGNSPREAVANLQKEG